MTFLRNSMAALLLVVSVLGTTLLTSPTAAAQQQGSCSTGGILSFPRWYDNGICSGGKIVSPAEMGISKFIWTIVLNIIDMMLYAVGYISLAFVIWGGFKFMLSGDNAAGTASARKTILNAIIGLILSIMSIGIVNIVAGAI